MKKSILTISLLIMAVVSFAQTATHKLQFSSDDNPVPVDINSGDTLEVYGGVNFTINNFWDYDQYNSINATSYDVQTTTPTYQYHNTVYPQQGSYMNLFINSSGVFEVQVIDNPNQTHILTFYIKVIFHSVNKALQISSSSNPTLVDFIVNTTNVITNDTITVSVGDSVWISNIREYDHFNVGGATSYGLYKSVPNWVLISTVNAPYNANSKLRMKCNTIGITKYAVTDQPYNGIINYFFVNTISVATSINEKKSETNIIIIYPNPAQTYVQLNLSDDSKKEIKIYNLLGSKYFETTTSEKVIELDTREWPQGVYFVSVNGNSQKLIIE